MNEENKSSSPACGMSLGEAASKASQEWGGPLTQNHDPSYWKSIREAYACGFMRGFNDCDSRKRVSDREPDALQTAGTKHVGISDLLDCAGWLEKKAQQERSVAAQWATEGRKSPHNIEAAEKFEAWARVMRDEVAAQSNAAVSHAGLKASNLKPQP
jgi:hypothetical protein